jgi:exopolysaccharide production protein ExoZ
MSIPVIGLTALAGRLTVAQSVATFLFWPLSGAAPVAPYLAPGWSLCFEMIFYSAVSLALIGGELSRNVKIGGLAVIALLIARSLNWGPAHILANPIFIEFGFGAGLAYAWPWLRHQSPWIGAVLIVVCLGLFAAGTIWGVGNAFDGETVLRDRNVLLRVATLGVPAGLLVAGALICEPWAKGRVAEVFSRLGDASYSLYLSHSFVLLLLAAILARTSVKPIADLWSIIQIAVCVTAGWLVYLFIERPILAGVRSLGKTITSRLRSRAVIA